jgi:ferredoxin
MSKITVENLGVTIEARAGQSILISLQYEALPIHTVCGGRARCGCCRIRILEGAKGATPVNEYERVRLGIELIEEGWRLACQVHVLHDVTIFLPTADELDASCSKGVHSPVSP